jgi:hypothetical protein
MLDGGIDTSGRNGQAGTTLTIAARSLVTGALARRDHPDPRGNSVDTTAAP